MRHFILFILLLGTSIGLKGQYLYTNRVHAFEVQDTVRLDSLSIVPSSFKLFTQQGGEVDSSVYSIAFDKSQFILKDQEYIGQKLSASYRVFPINFAYSLSADKYRSKSDTLRDSEDFWYMYPTSSGSVEDVSRSRIQANGNISRGLSSGNGQNLVLNSNLNLQLSGQVDDKVSIEAVLSDKNVPVQPNGYTQQINAFDQIYIRLFDSLRYLQVGDVDVKATNSHFLKFQKRLQGADFAGHFDIKGSKQMYSQASAAIAKGTFNRATFSGIEGVQGPYPLFGVNNEQFIVVLAGSERVFIDGQLLVRGEQNDYVINYNTAGLSFTPKVLVTKDSRIIVEFEYSDRNYNRFLVYGQSKVQDSKSSIGVQFFSESDAKNQPVNQPLTDVQKQILSDAGDNPLNAVVPDVDSIAFDKNQVLYAMVDSMVGGIWYDSIFKVSFNPDSAFYQLGFALVGQGKGNYIQISSAANGKVFEWVAPENTLLQGNYEPIQLLVAPKKQQMIVLNGSHKFSENTEVSFETAFSNKDINVFSVQDDDNNKGIALKAGMYQYFNLKSHRLKAYANYEYLNKDFNEVERFQSAEFQRDWNLLLTRSEDQSLLKSGIALIRKRKELGAFEVDYLKQRNIMEGLKLNLNIGLEGVKDNFSLDQSYLLSEDVFRTTNFYRHNVLYQHQFKGLLTGVRHEMEDNKLQMISEDSLLANSRKFTLGEVFVKTSDSLKRGFSINYRHRMDYLPYDNEMVFTNVNNDLTLRSRLSKLKNNNLVLSATYRKVTIKNEALISTFNNEDNFLARLDHQLNLVKRVFNFSTFYEVGSGLEAKQEYMYVEVAPGQGVYVWVDYNDNGIPELDEFEISKFPEEANYIRVYIPTNEFIKAYVLKFNHTFKITPAYVWRNEKGFKKFIARFSNSLSLRLSNKQTNNALNARLNPFYQQYADSSLLNNRTGVRNAFSFNRSGLRFGADWIFSYNAAKNLMVNGFDQSYLRNNQVKLRWNITRNYLLRNNSSLALKQFDSDFFADRNYKIKSISNTSIFQWQPTTKFRLSMFYTYSHKNNYQGDESSFIHELGPELKFNKPGKGTLGLKASAVQVNYSGQEKSSIAYEMLNGFLPGLNYTWNVNWAQNLSQYLRLSLNYSGRKATDSPIIHLGQVNLSAFF